MTINEKATELDKKLRGSFWYLATGVDTSTSEIVVYASVKSGAVPDTWQGVKVTVKVVGK